MDQLIGVTHQWRYFQGLRWGSWLKSSRLKGICFVGRPSRSNGMDVLIKKIKHRQHQALLLSTCVSWDDVKGSPNGWLLGGFIIGFDTT